MSFKYYTGYSPAGFLKQVVIVGFMIGVILFGYGVTYVYQNCPDAMSASVGMTFSEGFAMGYGCTTR